MSKIKSFLFLFTLGMSITSLGVFHYERIVLYFFGQEGASTRNKIVSTINAPPEVLFAVISIFSIILLVCIIVWFTAFLCNLDEDKIKNEILTKQRQRDLEYQLERVGRSEKRQTQSQRDNQLIDSDSNCNEIMNKLEYLGFHPNKISSIIKKYEHLIKSGKALELCLNLSLDFYLSPLSLIEKNSLPKLESDYSLDSYVKVTKLVNNRSLLTVPQSILEKISTLLDLQKEQIKSIDSILQEIELTENQAEIMAKLGFSDNREHEQSDSPIENNTEETEREPDEVTCFAIGKQCEKIQNWLVAILVHAEKIRFYNYGILYTFHASNFSLSIKTVEEKFLYIHIYVNYNKETMSVLPESLERKTFDNFSASTLELHRDEYLQVAKVPYPSNYSEFINRIYQACKVFYLLDRLEGN
ncbi:MAG TPA: hypothetical protein DDZ80_19375 [Cyanobacteria bacterium UBA8803]|nr:hypothetical protein [Cyanobacteria bacterium UBA9273]HBL60534.1 hypothetical protein [Cyanobacteria bacterium UBA8803]